MDLEQSDNESDSENSGDEEYRVITGKGNEIEDLEEGTIQDEEGEEPIILTTETSVKDQLKFIISEESNATTFGVCLKCGSSCSVSVKTIIGSYCTILISSSSSVAHDIS